MTVLSTPTIYNEIPINHAWCGQCAMAGIVTDYIGRVVTPKEFDSYIPSYLRISDGTTGRALVAAARSLGLPCSYYEGVAMSTYLPQSIGSAERALTLTQCNGYAQPVPRGSTGIAHWRDAFGVDASSVATANPWGGVIDVTPAGVMYAADLFAWVQIDAVMPADLGVQSDPLEVLAA